MKPDPAALHIEPQGSATNHPTLDELKDALLTAQRTVHFGQFHQWDWDLCQKPECKFAREMCSKVKP